MLRNANTRLTPARNRAILIASRGRGTHAPRKQSNQQLPLSPLLPRIEDAQGSKGIQLNKSRLFGIIPRSDIPSLVTLTNKSKAIRKPCFLKIENDEVLLQGTVYCSILH